MRPFDYYGTIKAEYPSRKEFHDKRVAEIDNMKLTNDERTKMIVNVAEEAREWFSRKSKPYREESSRLNNEFIADCRAELEYGQLLNSRGCEAVESVAYEMGHSAGHSEVYHYTRQLSELAVNIYRSIKETK